MKLTRGMRVMIYEDPITKLKPEDVGTLVAWKPDAHGTVPDGYETWSVRFKGERGAYIRTFAVEDVTPDAGTTP